MGTFPFRFSIRAVRPAESPLASRLESRIEKGTSPLAADARKRETAGMLRPFFALTCAAILTCSAAATSVEQGVPPEPADKGDGQAGVAKDATFIIGKNAGHGGTVAIPSYPDHLSAAAAKPPAVRAAPAPPRW
jgi:hypothetical protein